MNPALALLLAMVGVSLFATFDVQFSLGKVAGTVLGVLMFWAVVRWLTTPGRLRLAAGAFLVAGAVLAVLGLFGSLDLVKYEALKVTFPQVIRGVPGAEQGFNPNAVAGCLVLFIPLQLALLASAWRSRPGIGIVIFQVLLLIVTGGTLLLMQARAAWLGMIVAAVFALAWRSRIVLILVLAAAAAGTVALATKFDRQAVMSRALASTGSTVDYAIAVRLELWSKAVEGIREHPVTGMGMNAFRKLKPVRFPIKYPFYVAIPEEPLPHSHNHLLQAALDLGIPGLIAYAAIWLLAATLLARVHRLSRDPVYRAAAAGLGAGLVAHFVFSTVDAIPLGAKVGILFWLTLALATGLHQVALATDPARYDPPN